MSLLRREKWQAAELSLAESIATGKLSKERNALALYWRGVSSVRAGHAEKGVEYLKAAVKESLPLDESREARLMIADADFNAGRTLEAKKEYSLLVREGALVRMSAAKALAVGRILEGEEAKLCAQSLIKSDSPQWRQAGFALLGEIEEKDGAFGAAVYSYTKAMEEPCVTESLAKVSLRLGVLEVRGGDYKKAEKALKKAVELNAENGEARAEAYLTLSRASLLRNDIENARAYATVVTALFDKTKFAEEAEKILKENAEERQ
jgi:tetratricopeptide (TPR) repeat protein